MTGADAELQETHSVLLYERDRVNCELLADRLADRSYLEVVGTSVTPETTLELIESREPDLVVAHGGVPNNGALRLAQQLRARQDGPDLVVFGIVDDAGVVLEYLESGATACLPDGAGLDDLDRTIRAVLAERVRLDPEVTYRTVRRLAQLAEICQRNGLDVSRLKRLTPREHEVLRLLGEKLSNQEIAERLYVELSTVKSHVHSILEKLEVASREEAARYLLLSEEGEEADGGD